MPRAFYAISYQQTGLVLSYCELAKQDLSKSGAVAALLDEIVGDELELSFSFKANAMSADPIKIPKAQLNLDEVNISPKDIPTVDAFTSAPHTFMLDLTGATATAGDGTVKKLLDPSIPSSMFVASPTLSSKNATPPNTVHVKFQTAPPDNTLLYAIVDGHALSLKISVSTTTVEYDFPSLPSDVAPGSWHTVVFASRGYTPCFDLLQAGA